MLLRSFRSAGKASLIMLCSYSYLLSSSLGDGGNGEEEEYGATTLQDSPIILFHPFVSNFFSYSLYIFSIMVVLQAYICAANPAPSFLSSLLFSAGKASICTASLSLFLLWRGMVWVSGGGAGNTHGGEKGGGVVSIRVQEIFLSLFRCCCHFHGMESKPHLCGGDVS